MKRSTIVIVLFVAVITAFGVGLVLRHGHSNSKTTIGELNISDTKTVNLSGQQLTSLPEDITGQSNITDLNISNNQLTSLPSSISNLENVRTLNVENNRLVSLPDQIGSLTQMTTLDVSNNRLTSLPASLSTLSNLKTLKLGGYKGPMSDIERLKAMMPNTNITY